MAKQEQAAKKSESKTRNIRTPEERIAELEAQLAATKARAEAKKNKARDEAWAKRSKLVARITALQESVDAIDAEFPQESFASIEADEV